MRQPPLLLSAVLVFVGIKMLTEDVFHVSIWLSLAFIGLVLVVSVAASLIVTARREHDSTAVAH